MEKKKIYLFLLLCFVSLFAFGQTRELSFDTTMEGVFAQEGRMYIDFSSVSCDNVTLQTTISSSKTRARYVVRLQYSIAQGAWFDVLAKNGKPVEYSVERRAKSEKYKIALPEVCNNKDNVRLCFCVVNLSGKDPNLQISLDDIQ